jgi:hypothetical protein
LDKEIASMFSSIDELAKRGGLSRSRAFSAWYAINFHDLEEDEALGSAASDGGNDQGIDISFADHGSKEIYVLQAHCPDNIAKVTPKAKWDAVTSSLPFITSTDQLKKAGRPDIADLIQGLKNENPEYRVVVGLIAMGLKSTQIEQSLLAHQKDKAYEGFTFFYEAQEDLKKKYETLVDAEAGIQKDELNFSGSYFEDSGDYGRAWIGSVSASELKRLHTAHADKLFAGNIRLFLGARKGGINEQIIKTAKKSPGVFWALNNGITIVADSADRAEGGLGNQKLILKRFSIVNGCQTTTSLVEADASPEAKVLARVIVSKTTLKTEIVRYNNSQNAVKIWTVRAADDIQERLRRELAKIDVVYAPKQEGSRKKKSKDTIELDKVTQYIASSERPFLLQAIDAKTELFDEPYQKIYKRDIKPETVYLAWLAGRLAEDERVTLLNILRSGADPNAGLLGVAATYWIIFCSYKSPSGDFMRRGLHLRSAAT